MLPATFKFFRFVFYLIDLCIRTSRYQANTVFYLAPPPQKEVILALSRVYDVVLLSAACTTTAAAAISIDAC